MPRPVSPTDGIAWVTGASTGIGRAVALRLAADGWRVAATARGHDGLAALVADAPSGRIRSYPGDISDPGAMAALVTRIEAENGPIALALLNAGIYEPVTAATFTAEAAARTMTVNWIGTVNCLAPVMAAMRARKAGQIAVSSSVAGFGGLPNSSIYSASKAALTKLAEGLKFDLDREGVLIQVIHPGFVKTPATDRNDFPMPFLMSVDDAADRIVRGLRATSFEITFPRRFSYGLKLLNMLPYAAYFRLVARGTGVDRA